VQLHQHILKRGQEPFHILGADNEGRYELDHVDVVPGDLRDDVVFVEKRNDGGLGKG